MIARLVVMLGVVALFTPGNAVAQTKEGDWLVRGRVIHLLPDAGSSPLTGLDVSDETTLELDFSYFVTRNLALELILATKRHDVSLNGANIGTVKHLPPTLTLQYHFTPEAKWRPYVGVGVNYTRFTDPDLAGGLTVDRNSWGAALQAGIDIGVTKRFFVNLDVKKVFIDTEVKTAAGAFVTKLDIDPVIVGVGVGWKF